MKVALRALIFIGAFALASSADALAAAKKKKPTAPPAGSGKRVIQLMPLANVQIQLPDDDWRNFGEDYQARLTTRLVESGKFILYDELPSGIGSETAALRSDSHPQYVWSGSTTPGARITVDLLAYSFQTGSKGNRMFYGFDERHARLDNEFPLPRNKTSNASHFGITFEKKGSAPFDSLAGLDLGEGLHINVLFAWLKVQYASYRSRIKLRVEVESEYTGTKEHRYVDVKGEGFFFDIVGAYLGYSAGIRAARRDAMLQAFLKGVDGSVSVLDRALKDIPLVASVDGIVSEDRKTYVLLGTGHHSEVKPGLVYRSLDDPSLALKVEFSNSSGSVTRLIEGDIRHVRPGMRFQEGLPAPPPDVVSVPSALSTPSESQLAAFENVTAPFGELKKFDFKKGEAPEISAATAFFQSLVEIVILPLRLARYAAYDQTYRKTRYDDDENGSYRWHRYRLNDHWSETLNQDRVHPGDFRFQPIVAVVDTGVDYNLSEIHDSVVPGGWDFISGDSRPYDDHYHGTQITSLILAAAPHARILPVKVFNPWGVTTSAALYSGIRHAVDHGAQVIVCAWATRLNTEALREAVRYAHERGVIIVAPAGDAGQDIGIFPRYPAAHTREFDNVLAVTGVDTAQKLLLKDRFSAGYSPDWVRLAVPASRMTVLEPRGGRDTATSTTFSAALAAAGLARIIADDPDTGYEVWIQTLLERARPTPSLSPFVKDGALLQF